VQVDHDAGVEFIGQHREPRKRGVAQRVRGMRREHRRNQRMTRKFVANAQALSQIFGGRSCPRTDRLGHRQADHRAHSLFAGCAGGLFRKIAAIGKTSDPRYLHLRHRRQDAVVNEFRPGEMRFQKRRPRTGAAQQRRRGARMGVDQPRHQHMRGPLHDGPRGVALRRSGARQKIENSAVAHHQCVVVEHPAARRHWHDPTGFDA